MAKNNELEGWAEMDMGEYAVGVEANEWWCIEYVGEM